ncbi:LysR family transcriptional regulator [Thalassomonas actiniarum]|uniref:LysR family transcriptional regulator n=1 Tax=Thalassomonas actiniarum TaxID=485447 RepID=A0AAE9YRS0_9GAMM|nr:LysR family transcriptional regulator [Thalassomonas actiniarum]WDD99691.1 LysR family transcriptional regulator [Thalassomonas actiniarum]
MNKLDLNLLKVLAVLLEELNVTAAAQRLNVTQSAVSKHLSRLRDMFADPLFERSAQGLKATPRAIELAPQLRQVIQQLEQLTRPQSFEPGQSQRRFHIHMPDMAYSLTFPFFMPDLLTQAPNVSLKTSTWNEHSMQQLLSCEIDMGIACREWDSRSPVHIKDIPTELSHVELLRENSLCLLREDHPALQQDWDIDTFLKYRHIQVTIGGMNKWLLDDVLSIKKLDRDIAIHMPDFHSAMSLCEQSDLILCAPGRHATKLAASFKLRILPIPVAFDPGAYVLMWHKHFEQDLGHKWLRQLIINNVVK